VPKAKFVSQSLASLESTARGAPAGLYGFSTDEQSKQDSGKALRNAIFQSPRVLRRERRASYVPERKTRGCHQAIEMVAFSGLK